jgi:hypothetical protein
VGEPAVIERTDWRERAGRLVLDPTDPDGEPIATPLDRRWLWRIEQILAVNGGNETVQQLSADLRQYLGQTCEHHWRIYAAEKDIPMHSQCLWCNCVEWCEDTEVPRG